MKKIMFGLCFTFVFFIFLRLFVFPQKSALEENVIVDEATPSKTEKISSDTKSSELFPFNFVGADIRNVLRIFSHKTGINIVAFPEVQGIVTMKSNDMSVEQALKVILEAHDCVYIKKGNVIKVLTKEKAAQEPFKTELSTLAESEEFPISNGTKDAHSDTMPSELISFDFKDADIRTVLRIFSHKTKIPITIPPDIQGHVTAKFNNVPWEQALKVILEMHDCIYIKEGSGLKVLIKLRMAKD